MLRSLATSALAARSKLINILLRLIHSSAVELLQLAFQLLAFALDHLQVLIRELALLLADLALVFHPVPFDAIPCHGVDSL